MYLSKHSNHRFEWPQVEKVWKGHRHSNARHLDWGWMNIRLIAHRILYSSLTSLKRFFPFFLCCYCYVLLPLQLWRAFMPSILAQKSMLFTLLSLSLFSALLLKPKRCRLAAALRCGANVIRLCSTTGRASETNFCVFIDWSTHSLLSRGSQICFQLGQSVLHASHQIYNVWTSSAILILIE